MDSLLSIVQMPAGVPVGTLAIGRAGAVNAALLAAAIARAADDGLARARCSAFRATQTRDRARQPGSRRVAARCASAILGGGQLGRMLALAGLAARPALPFLDPAPDAPAAQVGRPRSSAPTTIPTRSTRFAAGVDVVTYEFENVPVEAVRGIRRARAGLPAACALEAAQDRLAEKTLFTDVGCRSPPFAAVDDLADAGGGRRRGRPAGGAEDAAARLRRQGPGGAPQPASCWRTPGARWARCRSILEAFVPFDRELSIIAVRGRDGELRVLPAGREPPPRRHPARVARAGAGARPASSRRRPRRTRERVVERLDYVGVLAIELFHADGEPARQRDGAARAQLRALDDRGRGDEPVREPPARDLRLAARRRGVRGARRDGQPDRRACRTRRRSWPSPARTCTATASSRGRGGSSAM